MNLNEVEKITSTSKIDIDEVIIVRIDIIFIVSSEVTAILYEDQVLNQPEAV